MTTLKQIRDAKAAGDDSGYKYQLQQALSTGEALDAAEKKLLDISRTFGKTCDLITELTGLELRLRDAWGSRCYWFKNERSSINYPTRAAAIEALLNDTIEWM